MVSQEEFGGVPGLGHRNSAATGHRAGPPASDAFAVATVHPATTVTTASDGDLWPSTWADDGALYTACGDGLGFSTDPADFSEIVVNRIDGTPETGLTGTRLAAGRDVAPIWTDPQRYNSKPTGIDRKSTRLNSSHVAISYAVFCVKKKKCVKIGGGKV